MIQRLLLFIFLLLCLLTPIVILLVDEEEDTPAPVPPAGPSAAMAEMEYSRTEVSGSRDPLNVSNQQNISTDWRVSGTVKDSHGASLPLADVTLHWGWGNDWEGSWFATKTDQQGAYRFMMPCADNKNLKNVSLYVYADKTGYFSTYARKCVETDTPPEKRILNLNITLQPGAKLSGLVVNEKGDPVDNASVSYRVGSGAWTYLESTDSNGFYGFKGFGADPFQFMAEKQGVGISKPVWACPGPSPVRIPPLVLMGCGRITGRLTSPQGRGLAGARVEAFPYPLFHDSDEVVEDFFQINEELYMGLNPEELERFSQDYLWFYKVAPLVPVKEESWRGMLYGAAETGPEGEFHIAGLREGQYFLKASDFDWIETPEPLYRTLCETGENQVRFQVPIHTLKLSVVDGKAQKVTKAEVFYSQDRPSYAEKFCSSDPVDQNGEVTFMVTPGPIQLKVNGEGGLFGEEEFVVKKEEYDIFKKIVLIQKEKGTLRFQITDEYLNPISMADGPVISALGLTNRFNPIQQSLIKKEGNGVYSVSLPPDGYVIYITPCGADSFYLQEQLKRRQVLSKEETRIQVSLKSGGRLKLNIFPSLKREQITLSFFKKNKDGKYKNYYSNAFRSADPCGVLEEGAYKLRVKCNGFQDAEHTFKIAPFLVTEVNAVLKPKG